jgi:hypothetical protein
VDEIREAVRRIATFLAAYRARAGRTRAAQPAPVLPDLSPQ